jgi:ABC-type sugar transport system permease subunit
MVSFSLRQRICLPPPTGPRSGVLSFESIRTQLFSIKAYLTTIQFFDFGRGSAMGILYLIIVSVIITVFFQQMRKRLD